ncbi:MAG TPA: hypothetical protein VEA80_09690 [Vitreimonas sp.]|uniref:hypothetical protein n=1 Tax=Vitreimonas sp. TaxID=3069702 RepID=UPI002D3F6E0C|nr:hypothetical protein [Vitreimonas sp.]HYD87736.1 hypothetical protein [Vitreimonas sp.]
MSGQGAGGFEREVKDTIVKSGLTGVAATVLAVTIISPAGLGGMVGTSMASGSGVDPTAAENPYANLPAYPSPLTAEEVTEIRGQLASTAASMEFTRAATEAKIDHVRQIAMTDGAVTFAPLPATRMPQIIAAPAVTAAAPAPELRLTLSEPAPVEAVQEAAAPETAPAPAQMVQVSYSGNGGGSDYVVPYRDPHLELAELMFAHEDF